MKKLNFLSTLLLALIMAGAVSCKKKKSDPSPQERILGKWKITAFTAVSSANPGIIVDYYAIMDNCAKDNFYEYRSGGVLIEDEGPTKCSSSDPQQTTGSYTLSADGKTLTWTQASESITFEVLELSNTTKKLKSTENDDSGNQITFQITFTKM